MRTAWLSMGIVLAGLVALLVLGRGEEPAATPDASVATIARRVESLRGLRFETVPVPQRVSAAQARREGPPDSTEQVLHPDKYLRVEEPLRVSLDVALGSGWRRTASGTWGEFQTRELVGERAAAGWGGDRYELWHGPGGDVLAMRWRWDTPRDAREFASAARELGATARRASGDAVTLAWAPSAGLAARAIR
jgi:hypothetical protein